MTLIVGIDLAERHSAAVALDGQVEECKVVYEASIDAGPTQQHPYAAIEAYRRWFNDLYMGLAADTDTGIPLLSQWVIEEPHPHAVKVGPAYRIQGAILAEMQRWKIPEQRIRVTLAKAWQDHFGYTKREFGNSKAWAKLMCEGYDYLPGEPTGKKFKAKPKEDLRDAYLLARWLKETQ